MVRFERKESTVVVRVDHGVFYNDQHFAFKLEYQQEYLAELMKRQLQKELSDNLKRIRMEAYNEGWKDKSAKRKKRELFYGQWK